MKVKPKIIVYIGVIISILTQTYGQDTTLSVGDKAPTLIIQKWLKGTPIKKFEKDKIYLVEFTAFFCPGCHLAIPHLTELAMEFKEEIQVVSIYTGESNTKDSTDVNYIERIERLVKRKGSGMEFTVGIDDYKQTTKKKWGVYAYPTAFIVNRSGKIIWIGNPNHLESDVLKQVVSDKFNTDEELSQGNKYTEHLDNILKIEKKGDYLTALKGIDSLIAAYPQRSELYEYKFRILARNNDERANILLQWMLNSNENYNWTGLREDAYLLSKYPDYGLALRIADIVIENVAYDVESKVNALNAKARIYLYKSYGGGNLEEEKRGIKKAIDIWQEVLELCNSNGILVDKAKEFKDLIYRYQYKMIVKTNEEEAETLVQQMLKDKLEYINWYYLLDDVLQLPTQPNYDLALQVADMAIITSPIEAMVLSSKKKKADIYATKGDLERALTTYREVVISSEKSKNQNLIKRYKKALMEFKRKFELEENNK
ncbi:TlpA family protein disulfide reductase [Sinomicrobium kalidii]|uniref:TlpA disulfide reductase family protein n=1 Tax=Sinomicrobium kalidii TaxID=2900738 RepID=UPI001E3085DE|nr:TlpA disulfide reductase family protein [Sinomicrobium kalidii]UGU15317.1 TlpA family protein disulfide reductase [Sinomicrobium kalidii]